MNATHPSTPSPHPPECVRAAALILPILRKADAETLALWRKIDTLMLGAFSAAGLSWPRRQVSWWYLKRTMVSAARAGEGLPAIEARLRPRFKSSTDNVYVTGARQRAEIASARLAPHLVGTSVLDLGAGNGLIGEALHRRTGLTVTLADVLDYRLTTMPIILFPQGGGIPLADGAVDTTLIYLVLHHADDTEHLLREAARVTRQRLVIMEGSVEEPDTRLCNCFFDWFLNRVVQGADVNLPFNYRTIAEWQQRFTENHLDLVHTEDVGIDEPRAPEAHILYMLSKAG